MISVSPSFILSLLPLPLERTLGDPRERERERGRGRGRGGVGSGVGRAEIDVGTVI